MEKILKWAAGLSMILILFILNSCKKDPEKKTGSWTEEFVNIPQIVNDGWQTINNSIDAENAQWRQGYYDQGKGFSPVFKAYSFSISGNWNEYAFAGQSGVATTSVVSSWLITPPVDLKKMET